MQARFRMLLVAATLSLYGVAQADITVPMSTVNEQVSATGYLGGMGISVIYLRCS